MQELPIKDNLSIASNLQQEPIEEIDTDEEVAVEIRPGHIRFEPRSKGLIFFLMALKFTQVVKLELSYNYFHNLIHAYGLFDAGPATPQNQFPMVCSFPQCLHF